MPTPSLVVRWFGAPRRGQRHLRTVTLLVALAFSLIGAPAPVGAQATTDATTNPLAGDAKAIEGGRNIYRGRCAVCHGIDAKGFRGSDLTTGDWVHGGTDPLIFRTIARGVPGTEMPGHGNMSEDEVWMVIAYLRTLATGTPAPERGDAARGEQLYQSKVKGNCAQCHMVAGRGGRLGPNLTRIGAARSAVALEREIRRPHEVIPVGFETVIVVTADGRRIRGVRKNEDTFSIQIMTAAEQIRSFMKQEIKEVLAEEQSLMPVYGPDRLTDEELTDLVRYLRTLRGTP
jgi:putative heme-binding domain-containing protein